MDFREFYEQMDDSFEQDEENAIVRFKNGNYASMNSACSSIIEKKGRGGEINLRNGLTVDFNKYFKYPEYGIYYPLNHETVSEAGQKFDMEEDVLRFINPELRKNSSLADDGLRIPLSKKDQLFLNKGLEDHDY